MSSTLGSLQMVSKGFRRLQNCLCFLLGLYIQSEFPVQYYEVMSVQTMRPITMT